MTCPHRSALATLLLLAVVLVEAACRGVRAPEPDEVAEARRLLDAAAPCRCRWTAIPSRSSASRSAT